MQQFRNRAMCSLFLFFITPISYANDLKARIKGRFEFQSAFNTNNGGLKQSYVTENNKNVGFNSSANISVNIENELDNLFKYGAKIGLETTTKNDRRVASSIFMISDYGKLEMGSEKSANSKMKITGLSVGCTTAGGWDTWAKISKNPDLVSYITNNGNFLDAKTREATKAEYSRKITYYTPEIKGFQFGISYIADTTNTGYTSLKEAIYHAPVKLSPHFISFKYGIAYGLTYEYKPNADYKLKTAFVGEKAHANGHKKTDKQRIKKQFTDLNTYTIGAELNYKQYAIAGSYGNYMKSLTEHGGNNKDKNSDLYSVGGGYRHNKLATSLSLLSSNHKRNRLKALTFATEYKLAPGLLPYGEITSYKTRGSFIKERHKVNDNVEGILLILGMKLEI